MNLGVYPVIEASEWMSFQYRDTQDQLDQLPNQELHLVSTGPAPLSSTCERPFQFNWSVNEFRPGISE